MSDFIYCLSKEFRGKVPSDILSELVGIATELNFKDKEPIIQYGTVDTNLYITKKGIIRIYYFDGIKEITYGFTSPGTFMLSPNSFYMGRPAFMAYESCCDSTVLKISKNDLDAILDKYPLLCKEMFYLCIGQFFSCEMKLSLINGSAREKYISLLKNRPDIIKSVSMKVIASYLGVTPQYLCNLKKELFEK